ncbi:SpoIIE family protein phosphatase [Flammeovirga sp. MY04]|uniref:7TM diverse intracellular signaling domain-containing protein n=1 Tax=Flammeovirga sp. MY04 TaxID=1191459 RepID=UPI0008062995|nr:7TM diverse intracellular signaling domain-containing protein [Flammeovirga sp. MY04]ANQ51946.1 SpoIIE family protein phosphatase [Flammeovirga sp. MY04]
MLRLFKVLFFILLTSKVFAQHQLEYKEIQPSKIFVSELDVAIDEVSDHLKPFDPSFVITPRVGAVYYMQFLIENSFNEEELLINFDNWQYVEGKIIDQKNILLTGTLIDYEKKSFPFYQQQYLPLKIPPKTKIKIIVKSYITDNSLIFPENFHVKISTKKNIEKRRQATNVLVAFFFGLILIMLLFNLSLSFIITERFYKWYLFYLLSNLIALMGNFGFYDIIFAGIQFPHFKVTLEVIASSCFGWSIVLFSKNFLNIQYTSKLLNKLINVLIIFLFVPILVNVVSPVFSNVISHLLGIYTFILILICGLYSIYKKQPSSWIFLLGFGCFLTGLIIHLITTLNATIENNLFYKFSIQIGNSFELLIFSIAIAHRFKLIKNQNEAQQTLIIKQLQENEELQQKINSDLERLVEVRTHDLEVEKEALFVANQQITNSIEYAKQLQEAVLPKPVELQQLFKDIYIYYQPKDIVSGDFYWAKSNERYTYFAICDCTGHGVPGALMSMLSSTILDHIVLKNNQYQPHKVLNELSLKIDQSLNHGGKTFDSRNDGLDIGFCCIDHSTNELHFSGAFISLWILRDKNVIEIKGDRHPIGFSHVKKDFFNETSIKLEENDRLFCFTDGIIDQFGGKYNKKYTKKKLRNLICNLSDASLEVQCKVIKSEINIWKGDKEQTDDILFAGFQYI